MFLENFIASGKTKNSPKTYKFPYSKFKLAVNSNVTNKKIKNISKILANFCYLIDNIR